MRGSGRLFDFDRLMGILSAHATIREFEMGVESDVECEFGQVEVGVGVDADVAN